MKTKLGKLNLIVGILILSGCASSQKVQYLQHPYGGQRELDERYSYSIERLRQEVALDNEISALGDRAINTFHKGWEAENRYNCSLGYNTCVKEELGNK